MEIEGKFQVNRDIYDLV